MRTFLIQISVFICVIQTSIITNTLLKTIARYDHTQPITSPTNTIVSVQFRITSPVDTIIYAFAKASFAGYTPNIYQRSDFYGKNPKDVEQIDLQGLWMGKNQKINLKVPSSGASNIYVSIFNLDPSYRKSDIAFEVVITENLPSPICQNCQLPSIIKPGQCKCERCPGHLSGYDCSRAVTQMTSGNVISGSLSANQLIYFEIPASEASINIMVETLGGQIQVYFQQITFNDEIASFVNVAVGSTGTQGAFRLNDRASTLDFDAVFPGSAMSLVIGKYVGTTTNFKLLYQQRTSINIMAIVLGILGGILFIGLIAAAIFLYRRYSQPQQIGNIVISNAVVQQLNSDKLTVNQIQRYFPQFQPAIVKGHQDSNIDIKDDDQDCVICLCPIYSHETVRMGFCRHKFHSSCLLNWFKKQRNCPYCREDYSKSNTIKHFKEVIKLNGNKVLQGDQLIKAVIKYNHLPSSNKVSNEPQVQLVQVQSGQQIQNQN